MPGKSTLTALLLGVLASPVLGAGPVRLPHEEKVFGVAFTPDGRGLISAGLDGMVRVWDVKTRREVRKWRGHEGGVLALSLSGDGKTLATGGRDSVVRLWDVASGKERQKLTGLRGDVEGVALSPDARMVAATGSGRTGSFRTPADRRVLG
jgi:WD40 repeat protein